GHLSRGVLAVCSPVQVGCRGYLSPAILRNGAPHSLAYGGYHAAAASLCPTCRGARWHAISPPLVPRRCRSAAGCSRPLRTDCPCRRGSLCALCPTARGAYRQSRPAVSPLLCCPVYSPYVPGAGGVTAVQCALRLYRREKPSRRTGAHTTAGHSPVCAGTGLPIHHRDGVHCPLSWQLAWSRTGVSLCHLHQPGLEHDVLVLPVATDGTTGIGRGCHALSPAALATISAAGGAGGGHWAAVERHDELWRRLVLCRCQRGDQ